MSDLAIGILLASSSKVRSRLLSSVGIPFQTATHKVNESAVLGRNAQETAEKRAQEKAWSIAIKSPGFLVIGADQVLDYEAQTWGKPSTREEAILRLKMLQGKSHSLISSIVIAFNSPSKGRHEHLITRQQTMVMRDLSDKMLNTYIQCSEWQNSTGGYQFETLGAHLFVDQGTYDHSTILGLPLIPILCFLQKVGVDSLTQHKPPWRVTWPY